MKSVLLVIALLVRVVGAVNSMTENLFVKLIIPRSDELSTNDVKAIAQAQGRVRRRVAATKTLRPKIYANQCDFLCGNVKFPHCQIWAIQCVDYRRALGSNEPSMNKVVEVKSPECEIETNIVLHKLKEVVSPKGWVIIEEAVPSCYTPEEESEEEPKDVTCMVEGFNLWNTDDNSIARPNVGALIPICLHDYNYSFEAIANCPVDFDLLGPDGYRYTHTEYAAPYFAFANDGKVIKPAALEIGVYNLRAFPSYDSSKEAMVTFFLMDC